ncbi:Aspartate aminotransferase, mitochondrial, partial [Linum perenne]
VKLAYGRNDLRFAGVPALSGTGGCRLFAEFQRRFFPESPIYLPDPTWSKYDLDHHIIAVSCKILKAMVMISVSICSHYNIWTNASVPTRIYRYYHPHSKNPTGVDPTEEQWREISNLFKVKNHFPFFDMAYQGLVSGDMDRDAWSIRVFLDDGHLIGCSQSFSKTMGLFEHRVGCLSVLCSDTEKARQVQSQLHRITGAMYGSVPSHGLVLLSTVLSNPELKSLWTKEVKSMANHIQSTRSTLRESLELTGSNHNWEHITKQVHHNLQIFYHSESYDFSLLKPIN